MPLANLGDLRTAALGPRTDLVGSFPEILALAEQRIYFGGDGFEPLRIRQMEKTAPIVFTDGTADLPADFLDKRSLIWPGYMEPVGYESPTQFYGQEYARQGFAYPLAYTVEGLAIKVSPALTGTAKLLHYAKAPTVDDTDVETGEPLSADGDTNDILLSFPGIYLYGCQIEVYRKTRNADEEAKSVKRYADAVFAANRYTMVSRSFGGPLKRKVGFGV